MTKGIGGTILIVVAGILAFGILSTGRPLVPHMVGPITLTAIGVWLLQASRKG